MLTRLAKDAKIKTVKERKTKGERKMLVSELILKLAESIKENGDQLLFDDSGYYQIESVLLEQVKDGLKIELRI